MDGEKPGTPADPGPDILGTPSGQTGGLGMPDSFALSGRGSKLFSSSGRRGVVISTTSTVLVLAALASIFLLAPGARTVEHYFFSPSHMWQAFIGNPRNGYYSVGEAIWLNIRMFMVAEVLILPLALLVALIRQSVHPALFPLRVLSAMYVDFFRGVPLILVMLAFGLGIPGLYLPWVSYLPSVVYGVAALVLSYSAYVSEVYRAGLNAVHRSQVAAARSLGLSHGTALRYVVLPQAIRNIIPPLLNDFISLQKDTAIVSVIGVIEANRAAQIYSSLTFNFSSFTVAAILFLILTIPLARFTDRLIERDRQRRLAGVGP